MNFLIPSLHTFRNFPAGKTFSAEFNIFNYHHRTDQCVVTKWAISYRLLGVHGLWKMSCLEDGMALPSSAQWEVSTCKAYGFRR